MSPSSPPSKNRKSVAIIGAGPAGLFAAEILAGKGHQVTIYDRKATPARKFQLAGRGGLNITHSEDLISFLPRYGIAEDRLAPALQHFTPQHLRDWCADLSQPTFVGSSGRVFPQCLKTSPLLRSWLQRLDDLGVQFCLQHDWQGFAADGWLQFTNMAGEDISIRPDATLLALGGASWPQLGSDGTWQAILQPYGIACVPLKPSNCGFHVAWSDVLKAQCAGQPLKNIALRHHNCVVKGEVMLDCNGIEGNAVYALSAALRDNITANGSTTLFIDLRPDLSEQALNNKLSKPRAGLSFSNFMAKHIRLSKAALHVLRDAVPEITTMPPAALARAIKNCPLVLTAPFPMAQAISSAGGISWDEVDADFMLHKLPGVFAAGEMLDWEAPTGGYLLQGCFATAFCAARGIDNYLQRI